MNYVNNVLSKLKQDNITPFELSKLIKVSSININEIKLILLELMRRGIVGISNDSQKIYVNYNSPNMLKTLNMLLLMK